MRKLAILLLTLCIIALTRANDSVYFGSGNQLVPLNENDIAITREVLTIDLTDDGRTRVDVLYELWNRGPEKTVLMGFEADAPSENGDAIASDGKHPYIHNFHVTLNNKTLAFRTAVVKPDIQKIGLQKIKNIKDIMASPDWENFGSTFVNHKADSVIEVACAYYFSAHFRQGKNVVHHTYCYDASFGMGTCFSVPYKLTPATRWANRKIDDFVLRIRTPRTAKHFCILGDSTFSKAPFRVTEGMGKTRRTIYDEASATEVTLRNGTLEWHCANFCPRGELNIRSADILMNWEHENPWLFYDRGKNLIYSIGAVYPITDDKRLLRNLPYAHRGYVFRDKELDAYFRSLWWYMPDSTWRASARDFTPWEKKAIGKQK